MPVVFQTSTKKTPGTDVTNMEVFKYASKIW